MSINDILAYGPWEANKVNVFFENDYVENDKTTNAYINDIWDAFCKKRAKCYDSELLRLNSWNSDNDMLKINTGITLYSQYIGTRDPIFTEKCLTGNRANPIGMTIIPITSDRKIIITKRSTKMEQNPNKLYFCGGYAEPNLDKDNSINLVSEALREAREELGVNKFQYFNFIGLAYDPVYCHPELFSVFVLDITKEQILNAWSEAKDRDESEYLLFMSLDDVDKDGFKKFNEDTTWSYQIGVELFTYKVINNIARHFSGK